jgi:hypothetical protein
MDIDGVDGLEGTPEQRLHPSSKAEVVKKIRLEENILNILLAAKFHQTSGLDR